MLNKNNNSAMKFKIVFRGEMKRIPGAKTYDHLCKLALDCFAEPLAKECKNRNLKFYYLDEDHELISITSQSDFEFAMTLEHPGSLRLIIEFEQAQARSYLMDHLESTHSISSLIRGPTADDSQLFDRGSTLRSSNANNLMAGGMRNRFGSNNFDDLAQMIDAPLTQRTPVHMPLELSMTESMFDMPKKADIQQMIPKINMGDMLADAFKDTATCTMPVKTQVTGTQAAVKTAEMGCGEKKCKKRESSSSSSSDCPQSNEKVTCFKCKGSKLNKKGNPCKKCEGTGFFTGFPQEVADSVREQVHQYLNSQNNFQGILDEYVTARKQAQDSEMHTNFICDSCEMNPIRGVRYMCSVCNNYDLCQNCEANHVHKEHPLLKIRKAKQAPARIMCQYNSFNQSNNSQQMGNCSMPLRNPNQQMQCASDSPSKERFMARFVKDSHGDGLRVNPGQEFTCSWTYRNTGKTAWPKESAFIQTSGDVLVCTQEAQKVSNVEPEQEAIFDMKFIAPSKPGRYTTFFRLAFNQQRFGQKVWADILVMEPVVAPKEVEEIIPAEVKVQPELVDIEMKQPESVTTGPKMVPQDSFEIVNEEQVPAANLNVSQTMMMTPRQIYLNYMETYKLAEEDKQKMATLFEFGFVDFENNLDLLRKNKGDLEAVASYLSDQLLAKSTY